MKIIPHTYESTQCDPIPLKYRQPRARVRVLVRGADSELDELLGARRLDAHDGLCVLLCPHDEALREIQHFYALKLLRKMPDIHCSTARQ